MPYRYIYEIVNTVNGHTYVGQHASKCLHAVDVYWEKRMTAETHDKWHRRFR